jgi:UTP--glucose-1-phosphate uridylyltransferase
MLINEIAGAGVAEICVIIPKGEADNYRAATADSPATVTLVEQSGPSGYAGALWAARDFAGDGPFLHLVGDHVYIGPGERGWASRLVEVASAQECSVSAVQATHESLISRFGVVGGTPLSGDQSLYRIDTIVEKPTPTEAEQRLIAPGLRAGYYLAFFGMHVFTPAVLALIGEQVSNDAASASVSAALDRLATREKYLAWQVAGHRYDLGPRYGLLHAQLALGLAGRHRDEVLASLVNLISTHGAREQ